MTDHHDLASDTERCIDSAMPCVLYLETLWYMQYAYEHANSHTKYWCGRLPVVPPLSTSFATPPIIEKLRSKGVVMHAYGDSICILRVNQKLIIWPWAGPFEMNVKIEQRKD